MLAAIALFTDTQFLLFVLGGLYVIETLSVILQIASFRLLHRRVFRMAPLHLHFELQDWPETTVIVRFWILAGLAVAFGLGLFYAEFLAQGGSGG
jgi:phospho-N-acetylmuramoyl-pentapeptide-transferase